MTANHSERDLTRRTLLATAGTSAFGLAGCIGNGGDDTGSNPSNDDRDNEFVFVASARDEPDDIVRDWEPLAEWLERETGVPTRIDPVQDDSASISALAAGQADLAYPSGGPSWVGWRNFGLETLVAEADENGDTHYVAAAWVRADSDLETLAHLEGVDSCHTGDLKGAGMLIPMAALAHEGLVTFDDEDDINAIRRAVDEFFAEPLVDGGYIGALRCLSEGQGDVGFMRKSTPEDFCGGDDPESWCLEVDEYRLLEEFAEVPSHPVLVNPELDDADKERLQDALLALNDDPEGQSIIEDVFGVPQLVATTSEEHLGPYGELIEILPGIEDHLLE